MIKKRHLKALLLFSFLCVFHVFPSSSLANIPAAYLACDGAEEGEACLLAGPQFGICTRDTLCKDIEETSVNECMLCVDGCWSAEPGDLCVRPWTGEKGICEDQDRCTDKIETSFLECRRCVEGVPTLNKESKDKAGCTLGLFIKPSLFFWVYLGTLFLMCRFRKCKSL